jgi:hypothetical protein
MSTVASLSPQSSIPPASNSIDDQIKALEKRIGEGVKDGTISAQQGKALTKVLDQVQKAVDGGGSGANLSGADLRKVTQMLREIAKTLSGAAQGDQTRSASVGTDSDGDNDGSTGVSTLA